MKSQIQRQLAIIPFLFGLFLAACISTTTLAQTQIGTDIDGEATGDQFGYHLSLSSDGNRVAIGGHRNDGNGESSGHVRVYQLSGNSWLQLGADIDGEAAGDYSGGSVSLSSDGSRVAIGAEGNDGNGTGSGHVRVYQWSGNSWLQLGADIDGEAAGDASGRSVSLSSDGTRVAIGATGNDDNGDGSGHVRVYQWSGNSWLQLGADIDGEAAGDHSGSSVSLSSDGSRVAIGARSYNSFHSVRVFQWTGTVWTQLGARFGGKTAKNNPGWIVSLSSDGSRLAISAGMNDNFLNDLGQVRVYQWTDTAWTQLGADIDRTEAGDFDADDISLSADGNRLAVGTGENSDASGFVRVYQWLDQAWIQIGADINGRAEGDGAGEGLSLSPNGNRVAVGAAGRDTGHVRVYDLSMFNVFKINAGLNDAWYFPDTSGQGFFITVFPDLGYVSLAWFTYDTELPPLDAMAHLGDPGHRWLTAVGPIEGNQALMNIEMTSGGIFDAASVITRTDPPGSDGTILLTFDSCSSGTIEYDIPSINRQGIVPIQRVANDNIVLCEVLSSN